MYPRASYLGRATRKPIHVAIAPGHVLTIMFADQAAHGVCTCGRFDWSTSECDETVAMMIRAHKGLEPIDPDANPPFTESTLGDDDYGYPTCEES